MTEFKKLVIEIDYETSANSKVTVDGKEVNNIFELHLTAGVHHNPELVLATIGDQLDILKVNAPKLFIRPRCPNCGWDGERNSTINFRQDSPSVSENEPDRTVSKVSSKSTGKE